MEREKKSTRVSILGLELRVKTDTDPAYVDEIARFVETKVRETTSDTGTPSSGVALLAAMNIADDLYKERRRVEARESERIRRIEGLLKRVEDALKG